MKKNLLFALIPAIVMGIIATVVGGIVSSSNTVWTGVVIVNIISGILLGIVTFFALFLEIKVINKYYPDSKIESFKLAKIISSAVSIFVYILSVGGYVGFLVPLSLNAKTYSWACTIPFLAVAIMIVINALGLLFVAIYSFNYNKAILLEKNESNTYRSNIETESKNISKADEVRELKKLLDEGIITQQEFDKKKKELLGL